MAQRLDPFLGRLQQKVGQGLQRLQRLAVQRVQAEQEHRPLQCVRRIVRGFQQREEHRVVRPAPHRVAHVQHQVVGVPLEPGGAPGAALRVGGLGLQPVAHQAGQLEHQAGVLLGHAQPLPPLAGEVAGQGHLDAVLDQPVRLTGQQAPGRGLEDEAQELQRRRVAQHVAQPVAEAHRRPGCRLDRAVDQLRPAQLQEAAVPHPGLRRPCQQREAVRPAQEPAQLLARPVPVDQEHQARSQGIEVGAAACRVFHLDAPGRHVERGAGGQHGGARALPSDGIGLQHVLEERQPLGMDVGVGDADRPSLGVVALDVDHDHMRVRSADVVLDQQPAPRAGGGGVQAGMAELQPRGAAQPGHEGRHQRAVRG